MRKSSEGVIKLMETATLKGLLVLLSLLTMGATALITPLLDADPN
ncbi:MAG: hypothetical protein VX173_07920 [Pseudomonadota bacterium]|nr:hypothetical protein [Pseudomonadota bacterium]